MATSLAQKLQLKAGQRLALINTPAGYAERLERELEGVPVGQFNPGEADAVLIFAKDLEEASWLVPENIRAGKPDGLLWVAYPKGTSKVKTDVNRDTLWAAVEPTGWRPVRQIALDDVWSALRFRPADLVGK